MIREVEGNLLKSDCEGLVNTVNCVGVMGKGLAEAFRKAFPAMYDDYVRRCDRREVQPGHPYAWHGDGHIVINFPTKDHWRGGSQLTWIADGLPRLVDLIRREQLSGLAIPPLGCGLGGLDWTDVRPLIYDAVAELPIRVDLYVPAGHRAQGAPVQAALFPA